MMIHSKITSKGQTTVPKEVRDALGLKPGEQVIYEIDGKTVRLRRRQHVSELAGILYRPGQRTISIEEMDAAVTEVVAERDRRARS